MRVWPVAAATNAFAALWGGRIEKSCRAALTGMGINLKCVGVRTAAFACMSRTVTSRRSSDPRETDPLVMAVCRKTMEHHIINITVGFWFDNHLVHPPRGAAVGRPGRAASVSVLRQRPEWLYIKGLDRIRQKKTRYYMVFVNRISRKIKGFGAALAFLAAAMPAAWAATDSVVTDVRAGRQGATTRVVLELSRQMELSIFTLADPYRVVVDLPEVGWRLPSRPLPRQTGVLKKLRYGLFKPGNSRLVLDLTGPAAVNDAFLMAPSGGFGYRFVIDLAPTSRQAFVAAMRQKPRRVAMAAPAKSTLSPAPRSKWTPSPAPVSVFTPPAANASVTAPMPNPSVKSDRDRSRRVIAIDPGHGGADPGTTGRSGTTEKHITLALARQIKKHMEADGRYKVVLTRTRDVFVRLRDRIAVARDAGAELFVSIHADAIEDRKISGLSVYTLSEKASDVEAAMLAEKENKADLIAGVDLTGETQEVTSILIDLAQRESMNQSSRFASILIKELKKDVRLLRNTHRFAGFAVLKAPDVPSVLLEVGFLSNRRDEKNLTSKVYRARLAASIGRAVGAYFINIEEAYRQ